MGKRENLLMIIVAVLMVIIGAGKEMKIKYTKKV